MPISDNWFKIKENPDINLNRLLVCRTDFNPSPLLDLDAPTQGYSAKRRNFDGRKQPVFADVPQQSALGFGESGQNLVYGDNLLGGFGDGLFWSGLAQSGGGVFPRQ